MSPGLREAPCRAAHRSERTGTHVVPPNEGNAEHDQGGSVKGRDGRQGFGASHSVRCPAHTMPSADFCRAVREPHDALSHEFVTHGRPPEVSSTTFGTHPPDLQPEALMDMDFAITSPLVRSELPHIRFLSIGSCLRYRFLQTPPRGDALASRLSFFSIRMDGGLAPP